MHDENVLQILKELRDGCISVDDAYERLKHLPFTDLEFAKVDNHRTLRKGFPETIFCQGKTTKQIKDIAAILLENGDTLLATRADEEAYRAVKSIEPTAAYHPQARIITVDKRSRKRSVGNVAVISAGTADVPVAEEAAITAEILNCKVERVYDIGVAGLHRLLAAYTKLSSAKVVVVVAGMDGVLPSVIGGLVSCPVIAVPTSIGYGAHFGGLAPLLTMLNSCATGVTVVNIDNGFGAGYTAALINRIGEDENETGDGGDGDV